MKRLVLSLVAVFAVAVSASAQMSIKLNSGSNKWGYGTPFTALVQQWDGSAFDVETVLHFPESGNPGYLPRESFYGIYVQDTKHRHRYCPGIVNAGDFNAKLNPLPIGVTKHEAGGHWKPVGIKGHGVAKADSPVRLRLQFIPAVEDATNSTLILSYAPKGKEWTEAWRYDAPANFAPNLIGLTADSFGGKYSFDPVVFDYFHIKGDGPAVSDKFDGKGPAVAEKFDRKGKIKQWKKLGEKRAEFNIPVQFEAKFVEGKNKFVFDRGDAADIAFSTRSTLLLNDSVSLKGTLTDYEGKPLLTLDETIKFNKEDETVVFKLPAEVIDRNGIYRFNVEASHKGGELGTYTLQFAVIDPRPMPTDFDNSSPYSMTWIEDFDAARRMGIRQGRGTWFPWNVPLNRKTGKYNFEKWMDKYMADSTVNNILQSGPVCASGMRDQTPESIEKCIEGYVSIITQAKERYGDAIQMAEFYNEPENWPIAPSQENEYLTMARVLTEITRRVHEKFPDMKIMSTGCTHINMAFIAQMAAVGGPDAADVISVHGYRNPGAPEFNHDDNVRAIKSLFPDKPIWMNEDGYLSTAPDYAPSYDDPETHPTASDEITQAVYLPRNWLSQLAAGYTWVNVFTPANAPQWNVTRYDQTHVRPGTCAIAALTRLLPHPKFIKRLTPKNRELWALQFESDGKTVTAIWSLRPRWSVQLPAGEVTQVQDIYGNVMNLKEKDGNLDLIVGQAPIYILGKLSKIADYKEYTGSVRPLPMLPQEREPTALTMELLPQVDGLKSPQIRVLLTNNTDKKMSGTLKGKFNDHIVKLYKKPLPESWKLVPVKSDRFELAPGASTEVDFKVVSSDPELPFDPYNNGPGFVAHWHIYGYFFAFQAKLNDGQTFDKVTIEGMALRGAPKLKDVKIDGNLDEWKDVPVFPDMHTRNTGLGRIWRGPSDHSPSFKIAWCDKGLLFASEVQDDIHHQIYNGSEMWRCDSIDLAIDPDYEHLSFVDYHVFTLGLNPKNKGANDSADVEKRKEQCYRRRA
ncbi:MAG: hypothetical protein DRP23_05415, partial [Thermotogae bacterium]